MELERRLAARDSSTPVPRAIVVEAMEGQRAALAELRAATKTTAYLRSRPLVVLTRGIESSEALRSLHAALARASTNSRHTVVGNARHEVHLDRPDVVVQAVTDVLDALRTGGRLPAR
jgi:pimeloyl-ACP methyl ester carboxylesterase